MQFTVENTSYECTSDAPILVGAPGGELWVASDNAVGRFSPGNPAGIKEVPLAGELSAKDIDVSGGTVAISDAGHEKLITFNTATQLQTVRTSATLSGRSSSKRR